MTSVERVEHMHKAVLLEYLRNYTDLPTFVINSEVSGGISIHLVRVVEDGEDIFYPKVSYMAVTIATELINKQMSRDYCEIKTISTHDAI